MNLVKNKKTAALLVGFGGPTKPEEVKPFLDSVLQGIKIPAERFREVLQHYEMIGGVSNYNAITYRQKEALENWFRGQNIPLSVGVGFRHSFPSFKDAFEIFKKHKIEKITALVLSPFRCYSSFEKYLEAVERGRGQTVESGVEIVYTGTFFDHPLFIEAQTQRIKETLKNFSEEDIKKTLFIFSAHSIPVEMSQKDGYDLQFEKSSSLIAEKLGLSENWRVAYQSRSGDPRDAWLGPDVKKAIEMTDKSRFQNMVLIPVGFLCDNAEVVYDLDVEAKNTCAAKGFKYFRAPTAGDHPKFIEMMGELILERSI